MFDFGQPGRGGFQSGGCILNYLESRKGGTGQPHILRIAVIELSKVVKAWIIASRFIKMALFGSQIIIFLFDLTLQADKSTLHNITDLFY